MTTIRITRCLDCPFLDFNPVQPYCQAVGGMDRETEAREVNINLQEPPEWCPLPVTVQKLVEPAPEGTGSTRECCVGPNPATR